MKTFHVVLRGFFSAGLLSSVFAVNAQSITDILNQTAYAVSQNNPGSLLKMYPSLGYELQSYADARRAAQNQNIAPIKGSGSILSSTSPLSQITPIKERSNREEIPEDMLIEGKGGSGGVKQSVSSKDRAISPSIRANQPTTSVYDRGISGLSDITRSIRLPLEFTPVEKLTADQRDALKVKLQQDALALQKQALDVQGLQYNRQGEQVREAIILNRISLSTSIASWVNAGVNFTGSKLAEKLTGVLGKKSTPDQFPPIVP